MEKLTPQKALAIVQRHNIEHSTCGPSCYPEVTPATALLNAMGYDVHYSAVAGRLVEQSACAD